MGKKAAAFRIFIGPLSGVFHPSSAITWARATFRQQQADKKRLANYIPLASGEVCDPPKRFRSVDGAFIKLVVFFCFCEIIHYISYLSTYTHRVEQKPFHHAGAFFSFGWENCVRMSFNQIVEGQVDKKRFVLENCESFHIIRS